MQRVELDNILGVITVKDIIEIFDYQSPEYKFFVNEIKNNGLESLSIATETNLSIEEKRNIIRELIQNWNIKGEPITDL